MTHMPPALPEANDAPPLKKGSMRWAVIAGIVLLDIVVVLVVNHLPEPKWPDDPVERANPLWEIGLPERGEGTLFTWVRDHEDDVRAHGRLLAYHAALERRRYHHLDDQWLVNYYSGLRTSGDAQRRDIALWGLGYLAYRSGNYRLALARYDSVANQAQLYLHAYRGRALEKLGLLDDAARAFKREIGLDPDGTVYERLAELYLAKHDWRSLDSLMGIPVARSHLSVRMLRVYSLGRFHFGRYLEAFRRSVGPILVGPFALALLGAVPWFYFVRRSCGLKGRTWMVRSIAAVLIGIASTYLLTLEADLRGVWGLEDMQIPSVAEWAQVGLREEAVKLLPIALLCRLGGWIEVPADWFLFTCLSAVGFSANENYGRFVQGGFYDATFSIMESTPFHVALTGIAATGLALPLRHRGTAAVALCSSFLAAALIHGASDWLITSYPESIVSVLIVAAGVAFVVFLAGAVARSPSRQPILLSTSSPVAWFVGVQASVCGLVFALRSAQVDHTTATFVFQNDVFRGIVSTGLAALYVRVFRARTTPRTPEAGPTTETLAAVT